MESVHLLKSHMQRLGISSWEKSKTVEILFIFLFLGLSITYSLTSLWYIAFTARSFDDYVNGSYYWTYSIMHLAWYFFFRLHRDDYNALFLDLVTIIGKSKLWSRLNQKVNVLIC